MAKAVKVDLQWNNAALSMINTKTIQGLFRMGFDIAARARENAPYQTGALRNTIRVQEVDANTLEVIAGGSYGGKKVPYAWRREWENNLHPDRKHYMQRAKDTIMTGNYMQKYFGDITK